MRKLILSLTFLALVLMAFTAVACKEGPTTPTTPNSFKITDIKLSESFFCFFTAVASYSNYDDASADVSGKIYFGDGGLFDMTGPQIPKGSGTWQSNTTLPYLYLWSGTYRVKVELTAYFKRGPISSTFEKNFTIY